MIRMGVSGCFFWYRPTQVVLDQRPLNGCVCNEDCLGGGFIIEQTSASHYGKCGINSLLVTRNTLFGALQQLSGTHYRKLFSVVTLLQFLSLS